jgi:hypothetical protein
LSEKFIVPLKMQIPMSSSILPTRFTSRSHAYYFMRGLMLMLPLLLVLAAVLPSDFVVSNAAQQKEPQPVPAYFLGEVEYRVSASGTNKEGVEAFKAFSPVNIKIAYGKQGFRLIESGGAGNDVLLNYDTGAAYLLDADAKTATKVSVQNLDGEDAGTMASVLPYHYKTDMQPTGKTATIGGQLCREYKVFKSAFIRNGATASMCVAEAVNFKPSRYSFQNESSRADSPLPLSVPIPKGAIMRMEINESGVAAVYEVVRLTPVAPPAAMFSVPADYKIESGK